MHYRGGSMVREVKAMVSMLWLAALNNTQLLAGGGLGMALLNILVSLRWMPFLGRSLLTVTLMFMATAILHFTDLPNSNTSVKGSNKHMAVAAATVMYCQWALPQMLISDQTRPTPTARTAKACVEAVALHLLFTWALALGLRLGLEGVAMATWCSSLAAMLLSAIQNHNNEISVSREEAEDLGMGMGIELDQIWYDCLVLVAWLLPSPVPSVAAAAAMMRTASLLHALSAALARSCAHFHAVVVCVLGLTQGLLVFMAVQMALHQWSHSRSPSTMAAAADDNQMTLSIIQRAMPTLGMWAVAACTQSNAWAYLCSGRGGGEGMDIMAVGSRVRLQSMCFVGAPVLLISAFGLGHGVEGLCHGVVAAQVMQAVTFTSLMFRTSARMHMPVTVTANPMEAGSEEGTTQSPAGLVEDSVGDSISNFADDGTQTV